MPSPPHNLMNFLRRLCLLLVFSTAAGLHAQVPRDFAVDLKATVSETVPRITLSWTQRLQANITAQKIHRRLKGETVWVQQAVLGTTDTSYADTTALSGVEYEYWMQRTFSGVGPSVAMGYLSAGVNVPATEARGKLLLVVDDTMVAPLAPEIAQLRQDLAADGWLVEQITAPRAGTAINTKVLITAAYNADPANVKAVYLLGHVPVPYSGYIGPDGHGDHFGAWPADAYYGDMNGSWTDASNYSASVDPRQTNVAGDGKFDQSKLPSLVELEVGRVDLHSMTKAPTSAVSETTLLRRYLRKTHEFRYRLGAYASIPRQALIRDGFGYFYGENFAMTGWANALTGFGRPPAFPIDESPDSQWFSASYAGGKSYLVGYGGGAGYSTEVCAGMGSSLDFGTKRSGVVFPALFGSYFGDWDKANNLTRSVLAGNANGDSLGLACFWAGRPNWFTHHMGMGETIGYSARLTQGSGLSGGGGYSPGGASQSYVHVALMGDPALRLHMVQAPQRLAATSSGGQVVLQWESSTEADLLGYSVYRSTSASGPFTRLNGSALSAATYTDTTVTAGATYTYLVRTLKLESVPGGTYQNLSHGSVAMVTASAGATSVPASPTELVVASSPSTHPQLTWADTSGNETGFRIERKTNATGTYAAVGTVAANATSYSDSGLIPGNVYFYRVIATGTAGDSFPSNETSFEAIQGFMEFVSTNMKVNKDAGTVSIGVKRFGGGAGAASVQFTTANAGAIAGTHYTATSGTLSWADGETGIKTISVPIMNTAQPQIPRGFQVNLSNPSGGSSLAITTSFAVLIEDSSASLPTPWNRAVLGEVLDSSPAVEAEGVLADATFGGNGYFTGANYEAGSFLYQTLSGDGVAKVFVPTASPAQYYSRVALMVRADTSAGSVVASAVIASSNANSGAQFSYRSAANAANVDTLRTANTLSTPCWLRITRAGNTFTAEASPDNIAWTVLGSTTLASMPSTAYWGVFHSSESLNTSYQTVQYQSFTVSGPPPIVWDWNTPAQWPNGVVPTGTRVLRADLPANGAANLTNTASVPLIVNYTGGYTSAPTGFNELIMGGGVTLNINAPHFNVLGVNQAGTPLGDVILNANSKLNINSGGVLNTDGPVQTSLSTANIDVNTGGTLTWGNNVSNCVFYMGAGTLNISGSMSAPANGGGYLGNRGIAMRGSTVNINGGTAKWNWTSVSEQYSATLAISNNGSLHNFKSAGGSGNDGILKVGTWSNIGSTATVNISTGGTLTNDREMLIASTTPSSPDNTLKTATVTMTGGAINQGAATQIGYARVGILNIQGGTFTTTGTTTADATVSVGGIAAATLLSNERQSGELNISGGIVNIHNATNSALLRIGNAAAGKLTMSGGTLNVDQLTSSNSTTSVFAFSGGTINSKGTTIANGSAFTVGDGSGTAAILSLGTGTHTFANGLQIAGDGAVSLGGSTVLAATTAVAIATGGTMNLNFAGNSIVASLIINGVPQPNGLYGAASHPAIFTGAGRIQVGAAVSGYDTWAYDNGIAGQSATGDFSHDGLANLVKYALGLDPRVSGSAGRLAYGLVTDARGNYLSLTYTRPDPAPAGITYSVESCSDLAGWTTAGLVETSNTANAGLRTITVSSGTPLTGGSKSFLRLKVSQP